MIRWTVGCPRVHNGDMTPATKTRKRVTKSKGPDIQQVDSAPVDKKPLIVVRDIVDMTAANFDVSNFMDPCQYCWAHRFHVTFSGKRVLFTPHMEKCPVIPTVFPTPERLANYDSRKAQFFEKYKKQAYGPR